MYQGKPFSLIVTISSYTYPMLLFRFLRHEWKSESISVPPGHRVVLSQFVDKLKQLIPKSTNKRKKEVKGMEARHTYTKRVKQECHSDNKAGEADAQLPCMCQLALNSYKNTPTNCQMAKPSQSNRACKAA